MYRALFIVDVSAHYLYQLQLIVFDTAEKTYVARLMRANGSQANEKALPIQSKIVGTVGGGVVSPPVCPFCVFLKVQQARLYLRQRTQPNRANISHASKNNKLAQISPQSIFKED
jgi:hypothetical protein